MNKIKKVIFNINYDTNSSDKLDMININNNNIIYKIISLLGTGSVGSVYLVKQIINNRLTNNMFTLKISNINYNNTLLTEIKCIEYYFLKYNIYHDSYPLYYGEILNMNRVGVIYNFCGNYNLERLREIKYNITFKNNISIIRQIINQMLQFNSTIHCDLKPANIVIDINNNNIIATIIDFGLMHHIDEREDILSTSYIVSPESLFTIAKYKTCLHHSEKLDLSKHDYFGLFINILNLFVNNGFWTVLFKYISNYVDIKMNNIDYIFIYIWYKLSYDSINMLESKSLINIVEKLEHEYPILLQQHFLNFDEFFNKYIIIELDYMTINKNKITQLKDFIKYIIAFNPDNRPLLTNLLIHDFIVLNI